MRVLVALLTVGLLAGASVPALAHAFLDHATPAVGSTVRSAPAELRLMFTEPVESAFSTVQVLSAAGARVDRGDMAIDPADRRILHVSLSALPPGTYKVIWRVLSVDTHMTMGDFVFHVAS
jgi:methionine-rich copper-binding protein CopC